MANQGSIQAQKGRVFLLGVAPNGVSPKVYTTVGGLRATGLSFNGNPVDITNKSSGGWRELLPDGGIKQMTFTGSGIFDASSVAFKELQAAAIGTALIEVQIESGSGEVFIITAAVSQFQRDGTHNDAETFSLTLESHGPVYYSLTP